MSDRRAAAVEDSLRTDDVPTRADEQKLGELLLLVADELMDDRYGGSTKVNKVLFYAEFAHMRSTGRPITGTPYQKLEHGPAPRRLRPVRERLIASGAAELVTEVFLGHQQHRLVAKRPANRALFADSELHALAEAVELLKHRTATEVSELSHREAGWQLVDYGENIPYVTAYLDPDQHRTSPRIRSRAAEIAAEYGVQAQSK